MSQSMLTENAGLHGTWGENGIKIFSSNGFNIGSATPTNGLYQLNLAMAKPQSKVLSVVSESVPGGVRPQFITAAIDFSDQVWM